jgi:hypothetical protein
MATRAIHINGIATRGAMLKKQLDLKNIPEIQPRAL